MAVIKESECGGWARTCPGSARASRAGDGALAIANFYLGNIAARRCNVHARARALP